MSTGPRKFPPPMVQHSVRLPPDLWDWVEKLGRVTGFNRSEQVRALLMALRDRATGDGDRG